MELRGVDENGNFVKAPIKDFAEKMRKPVETVSMGGSPTSFVYTDRTTGQTREVDLQETAQAVGIRNVQFHFDPKQARESGFLGDRDIDKGVAYNLERIKTEPLRLEYLRDKGFQNVVKNGDDYFAFDGGRMFPINNREGLDLSDFARLGATAGRDVGAGAAATAAIGGSAIATGGLGLAGGIAVAAAAGAAGGVAGETAQRAIDSLVGADAAKYNRRLSVGEEVEEVGKSALIGGIGGAAQPLLAAGGAKLAEKAVAPAMEFVAERAGSEFLANQAAKMQANALMTRLPQGAMSRFASAEEASTMAMLNEGKALLKDKSIDAGMMKRITGEGAELLAPGAAKPARDAAEEHFIQAGLRKQYETSAIREAREMAVRTAEAEVREKEAVAAREGLVEAWKGKAETSFPTFKKELETIFNPETSLDTSKAAQEKIVASQAKNFSSATGIKLERDPATNQVLGLDSTSFKQFVGKQVDNVLTESGEYLNSLRTTKGFLNKLPDDRMKGSLIQSINQTLAVTDDAASRAALQDLKEQVVRHGSDMTGDGLRPLNDAFTNVAAMHRAIVDNPSLKRSTRTAFDWLDVAMREYDTASSTAPDIVSTFYAGHNKAVEMKILIADSKGAYNDEVFDNVVRGLDQLTRTTGDSAGSFTRPLVEAVHMDHILSRGNAASPVVDMLTPAAREHMNALAFVKNYEHYGKKVIPTESSESKQAKRFGAGALNAGLAMVRGGDVSDAFIAGYLGGGILQSGKAQLVKKAAGKAAGAISGAVKGAGKKAIEKTAAAAESKIGRKVRQSVPGVSSAMVAESQYPELEGKAGSR